MKSICFNPLLIGSSEFSVFGWYDRQEWVFQSPLDRVLRVLVQPRQVAEFFRFNPLLIGSSEFCSGT